MTQNIREYLATILNDKNEKNWYEPELFAQNTLAKLPHGLRVVALPPPEKENYNCFIFALHLDKDKQIIQESKGFIHSSFFEVLLDKGELEMVQKPAEGDIVCYRNPKKFDSEITHAGIVQAEGVIISKWSWGPIIQHKIFDVPDFYGDEIFYVKRVGGEKAKELYSRYKVFNINIHSQ